MKRLFVYLITILGIQAFLLAASESVSQELEAEYVDAGLNCITLSGNVKICHPLGILQCELAQLDLHEGSHKDFSAARLIRLKGNVSVELSNGGVLKADSAEFNFESKEGVLLAEEQSLVCLEAMIQDSENNHLPIKATARLMRLEMIKPSAHQVSSKLMVRRIFGEDNVYMSYNQRLFVSSDRLTYYCPIASKESNKTELNQAVDGTIFLYSKYKGHACCLMDNQGSCIESPFIRLELARRKAICDYPTGMLFAEQKDKRLARPLKLSSDILVWDEWSNELELKGSSKLLDRMMGEIGNDQEIRISFKQDHTHRLSVGWIVGKGKTTLTYVDKEVQGQHIVTCLGNMFVDKDKGLATFSSPMEDDGSIRPDKQIHFTDNYGQFLADNIILKYATHPSSKIKQHTGPLSITISGNVFMFNHQLLTNEQNRRSVQAALADQAIFYPKKKEAQFSTVLPKKTLFFDQEKKLKISASTIWIRRDASLGQSKESIRTEGNVKFVFSPHEWDAFAKRIDDHVASEVPKEYSQEGGPT